MHKFQPYPIEMLEFNPFTKIGQEWALVTAGTKEKANSMTISWGGMGVLWGKNVVYIFIRDSRYTKEFLDQRSFFSLTFFDESYRDALNYCGSHSGRNINKTENAGLTYSSKHSIPYIDEGNLVFLCEKLSATKIDKDSFLNPDKEKKWYKDHDMHTMYVAEIIEVMAR